MNKRMISFILGTLLILEAVILLLPALVALSTFGRMLEPVVVKPETISKTASRYDGISPQSVNGSAPANDSTTHPSATHRSPSRA